MTIPPDALPSAALDADAWTAAHDELVGLLCDLIRIRSINPPDPPGAETEAAEYLASLFRAEGLEPEAAEPVAGRGAVHVRLRGDGTGGEPFLLLSHHDVVPVDPAGWTHPPFDAVVADGYVWGRGAVDMKSMVAMEAMVVILLARRARAAGLDHLGMRRCRVVRPHPEGHGHGRRALVIDRARLELASDRDHRRFHAAHDLREIGHHRVGCRRRCRGLARGMAAFDGRVAAEHGAGKQERGEQALGARRVAGAEIGAGGGRGVGNRFDGFSD